jgi:multicomponent Na+:H+ antiporter subunit D
LLSSITAIKQDNIKLRLAYSTIGQLSYIVLAISILAPYSILAATLHLIFHAIGKIILFLTAGIITTGIGIKKVSEMNGLASKFPYTIFLMSLGALIMIGLPPTIGFISKWYLIIGIIESTKIYLLAVIIISTLLNASYYFPMIYKPYFKNFEAKYNESNSEDMHLVAPVIIIGLAAIILFFNTDSIIMFIQEYIIKL